MRYKAGVYAGAEYQHAILKDVLNFTEWYCRENFGIEPCMTESDRSHERNIEIYIKRINPHTEKFYKPDEVPHSVHEYGRGADLRSRDFTDAQIDKLLKVINERYQYGPARSKKVVAMCHKVGDGAYHFHIQVSDKTRRRKI